MSKPISLAICIVMLLTAAPSLVAQSAVLQELTHPEVTLPTGCGLAVAPSMRLEGTKVLGGLWGNLPINANPWAGSDQHIIAAIRERMYGLPVGPDGPPVDRRAAARYLLHLAEGVEEGYAAFYMPSESLGIAAHVYALRFNDGETIPDPPQSARASADWMSSWFQIGRVVAVVFGNGGACFQAIDAHLKSLAR